LLMITSGDIEQNRKFFAEHQVQCPILVQQEREVEWTPFLRQPVKP
jgi:hypothetical protein